MVNNWQVIRENRLRVLACLLASIGICFFIGSCAGGTIGTGLAISGMLETTGPVLLASAVIPESLPAGGTLTPLPGVLVTVPGSSATDVTNVNGHFNLFVEDRPASVRLEFKSKAFTSSFLIADIPSAAGQVNLKLSFNPENDEITEESESFEDENGNEIEKGREDSSRAENESGESGESGEESNTENN